MIPRSDHGSISVELTLLTPLVLLLVLFVVAAGRLADAQARLDQAAYSAARAASLARDPITARAAATAVLEDNSSCTTLDLSVDTHAFVAGGAVTVLVTCVLDMAGFTGLGLPGSRTLTSTSTSPLDRFRTVNP